MTDAQQAAAAAIGGAEASTTVDGRAEPTRDASSAASSRRALDPAEIAWIALLPCAMVALAVILLLGPPLGEALFPAGSDALWPRGWWQTSGEPQLAKHGRFLLATLAPLLLVAVVIVGSRREIGLRPQIVRPLVLASHVVVLACLTAFLLRQNVQFIPQELAPPIFSLGTVVVAALLAVVAVVVPRRQAVRERIAALARETRARRAACLAIAVGVIVVWLLGAVTTDRIAGDVVGLNLPYTMNDAMAVLDGLTPLVDFHILYAKLLPYPTAAVLDAFGTTTFVYSLWSAVLSGLALLAVYAVLRLVARSSLLALVLFVPFLATSDLGLFPTPAGNASPLVLSAMWPMRYGGGFLMAWLIARHVAGRRPRAVWALFVVGGLVAINNLEFGLGAVAASVVALLCARPPRSAGALLRLGAEAAGGLLGAVALVCAFTLARAGELPDPTVLTEWPRLFTNVGWFSMTLPTVGVHLVLYATFVAAIAAAAVRVARSEDDELLTAMLAWSGVFGLLAASYFIGRPDWYKLYGMLSAWSFALALLTIAAVRGLAASGWRRPTLPQLLVLFGFGLAICSLRELPQPRQDVARLTESLPDPVYESTMRRVVGERTSPGQTVVMLMPMGHRIAYDLGLKNVSPYAFVNTIIARSQWAVLLETLRRERVRQVFVPAPEATLRGEGSSVAEQLEVLEANGFEQASSEEGLLEYRRG